jgi:PAS domain S-box-containing protein
MSMSTLAPLTQVDAARFIEESPVCLFSATLDGRILMINPSAARLMGYDCAEDMMASVRNTHDLWEDPERRRHLVAGEGTRQFATEAWVIRKNGQRLYVAIQACILPADLQQPARMEGALFDLSERRRLESDMAQREERFRMLSEQSLMGIAILQNERIVYANEALSRINGRSVETMLAWETIPFRDLIHPDDFAFAVSQAAKKQSGNPDVMTHYPYRLQLPDGSSRWIDQYSKTVQFDGRPADMVMQIDINDLKQAEKALDSERERLAVTLRSIADGVIATDNLGRIRLMSQVAENMTGWTQEDAFGLPLTEVFHTIHEGSRQNAINPIERVLESGDIVDFDQSTLLIARDGAEYRITKSGSPIRDSQGKTQGVVLVFRDTTEKERLIRTAQQAQKLESLGVLAGGIAHDFNNLLGSIFGYADLAHERAHDPKIQEYLHKVLANIERARGLTRQLLTFAKGGEPMLRTMALMPYLKETAEFALSGSSVKSEWDIAPNLPACAIDPNQIGQVIDNLVINAVQSMPQGGILWIKADVAQFRKRSHAIMKPGKYVRISFRDEGTGISPQVLPHIFDPFFTTKSSGSGLGLAMCYSIMKRHSGAIEVESKLGSGSTFTLWLPMAAQTSADTGEGEKKNAPRTGHILVMDDDQTLRELVTEMLEQGGYQISTFAEGKSLVEHFRQLQAKGTPPHCIILDLTVPGQQGGLETAKQIRKLDSDIPLFVASGYSEDPVMSNPMDFGFNGCLKKPFFKSDLLSQLELHLKRSSPPVA